MRINPFNILKEKESPVGSEAGVDPLPIELGPLDPLYKAWSFAAWPLALSLMGVSLSTGLAGSLVVRSKK